MDEKITKSIDETIKSEDIDRSHRLGKPKSSKNTFLRYNIRNRIYKNEKKLKGTGVTESLIAKKIHMLVKAKEEDTFNNVWSQDGKIIFFDKNTNKVKTYYSQFFFRR